MLHLYIKKNYSTSILVWMFFFFCNNICFSIGKLTPSVGSGPVIVEALVYTLCDVNGDGLVNFDLESQANNISNFAKDVTVSFYLSESDAIGALSPLDTSVLYTSSGEVLFTRAENLSSCFSTGTIELSLIEGPRIVEGLVYELCEENQGSAEFDLESQVEFILDGQTNIKVTFYNSEIDAELGIKAPLIGTQISGNKTLYTRLERTADCFNVGELELRVNPVPKIITGLIYALCDDDNDGVVDFDLDTQIDIILNGQTDVKVTFYESEDEAENETNLLTPIFTSDNRTVYARLENESTGCISFGNIELLVESVPEIDLSDTYYICEDDVGNPLFIDATPFNVGDYLYTWNPKNPVVDVDGKESSIYTITQGGNYSVTISDQNTTQFCETTKNIEVIALARPLIIDVLGASDLFKAESSSTIEVVIDNVELYEYNLDNGLWQTSSIFNNVDGGEHEVFVRNINGCDFVDSKEFELILFTSFFTPNGDNINDYWKIDGLSNEYEAFIYIYDRFGKLLKQIQPNGIGWDGVFNGKNMPSDDYWVFIEYTQDGVRKNFKSHFTLKR